jgi:threonine aldolase
MANQIALTIHMHSYNNKENSPHHGLNFIGSIVCPEPSHIYQYETNGVALLSRGLLIPVPSVNTLMKNHIGYKADKEGCGGVLSADIKKHIRTGNNVHVARTQVVSMENTMNGEVISTFLLHAQC